MGIALSLISALNYYTYTYNKIERYIYNIVKQKFHGNYYYLKEKFQFLRLKNVSGRIKWY